MSRWTRNPPSPKMAMMIAAIIIGALGIAGLERLGLWPDWAMSEKMPTKLRVK